MLTLQSMQNLYKADVCLKSHKQVLRVYQSLMYLLPPQSYAVVQIRITLYCYLHITKIVFS